MSLWRGPVPSPPVSAPLPGAEPSQVVGVRRVVEYIDKLLRRNVNLQGVTVRGEVVKPDRHGGGAVYFELKEDDFVLKCVVWKQEAARLPAFEHGDRVIASGNVVAYTKRSLYQLVVDTVRIDGVGSVHARFQRLKTKLEAEGVFALERKRKLPRYPFRIAIVSSRRARGGEDFLELLRQRAPHVRIVWCETAVQGPGAAIEIAAALDRASALDVDAVVVTRGGGSFEDLFCFSAEAVVRAIARSRHPVISAVGHTVDQQLADFVADVHAETPSAAAALASPSMATLLLDLRAGADRLEREVRERLERERRLLEALERRAVFTLPQRLFARPRERVERTVKEVDDALRARFDRLRRRIGVAERRLDANSPAMRLAARGERLVVARYRLEATAARIVERRRARVAPTVVRLAPALDRMLRRRSERVRFEHARLDDRNPLAILERGYAIVKQAGAIVRDPRTLAPGSAIVAVLARGELHACVAAGPEGGAGGAKDAKHGDD